VFQTRARQLGQATGSYPLAYIISFLILFLLLAPPAQAPAQAPNTPQAPATATLPPTVRAHQRFLARHGLRPRSATPASRPAPQSVASQALSSATWSPAGPLGVNSPTWGLVSGRISALAFDPSDPSGNHLYAGTTGGGLWVSQNAASSTSSAVQFLPLTDNLGALSGAADASLSVGAVTVQPGTGVLLVGLGDTNDALDSYYGAGILRSTNGGQSWSLIRATSDYESGLAYSDAYFTGLGFSAFAWSTTNVQLVVAGVTEAYEGTVVGSAIPSQSYTGLYYSQDGGITWHMSRITDGNGQDVQGPLDNFPPTTANGATSVVWNPVRHLFIAAINSHGYYQSSDGVTFTRMAAQPGPGFTAQNCPTQSGYPGAASCPIFRGSLAVNPSTGDTFTWSVDDFNQDQGIWQDQCQLSSGSCANPTPTNAVHLNTTPLETSSTSGPATILNGDYNLALAAIPSGQDTLVFAGGNDLWRCSLANSCQWRNTTNTTTCAAAQVGQYQHTLAWSPANPLLMAVGNDSGLWRSTDDVAQTGSVCASTDASHFQNLNAALGSLAEVDSLAGPSASATTLLAGLGANGVAGIVANPTTPTAWNQVLTGEGGPVAIDPSSNINNWFANNGAGVSIENCNSSSLCTPAAFGTAPVVGEAQVQDDGFAMPYPAPFVLDPLGSTNLLVGTCRVWRGPASGSGWTASNAISPMLDGLGGSVCNGNALIRSIAASAVSGGEILYVGMAGTLDGGASAAGHLFSATISNVGTVSPWTDLSYSPVVNGVYPFNALGFDISAITVDPHDASGQTLYVTIQAFSQTGAQVRQIYRTTSGGLSWTDITDNLPNAPVNDVAVDPNDANTLYIATDVGVYATRQIAGCGSTNCWTAYGSGLPLSPVTQLVVPSSTVSAQALTAGTYGRGVWQIALATASAAATTATVSPTSLTFASLTVGQTSATQTITLKATGTASLSVSTLSFTGVNPTDFLETDTCAGLSFKTNTTCTIKVSFVPQQAGSRTASLLIAANIAGGQILVPLTATGLAAGAVSLQPASLTFGALAVSTTSATQSISIQNTGGATITLTSANVSAPFKRTAYTCGSTLAANASCVATIAFAPTAAGTASGTLTVVTSAGTQTAQLSGTGVTAATDSLSTTALAFPKTVQTSSSQPMTVTMTNSGGLPLNAISTAISGAFTVINNCGGTLAAGSSCTFSVIFTPLTATAMTGTLTISDQNRAQNVALSGTGITPALIISSSLLVNFGSVEVGVPSATKQLTISDASSAGLTGLSFSFSGPGASSYALGTNTCTGTVSYGGPCLFQLIFTPVAVGATSATMTIAATSFDTLPVAVSLNGTGLLPPTLTLGAAQLNMGSTALEYSSAPFTVPITNTGQVTMNLPTFSIIGTNAADFAWSLPTDITGCTTTLAPAATCNVQVTFSPLAIGQRVATLVVTSTNAVPTTATVALTGTGVPLYQFVATPGSVTFVPTQVQTTSAPQLVTIQNQSRQKLLGISYSISGPYTLATSPSPCTSSLVAGGTCQLLVSFSPTASGDQPGSITVSSTSAGGGPLLIPLDGSGLAVYQIATAPSQFAFGSSIVGTPAPTQTLTVSNTTGVVLNGLTLTLNGNPDFQLTQNLCGPTLAIGASCTTAIAFNPATTGNRTAILSVTSTTSQVVPATVPIFGTGLPSGNLVANPATVGFGSVTLTQTSAPQSATIINQGAALTGIQLTVAGDYSLTSNTCGTQIAANSTCTVTFTFSPSLPGTRVGSLTVAASNAGYVPLVIGLTGTGLPNAGLTVAPSQLAFGAVNVGANSAPQQLTITNPGSGALTALAIGVAAPYNLGSGTCSQTLLGGASCSIPVTFSPNTAGPLNATLTVSSSSLGVASLNVPLTGTGLLPPSLSLSPTQLSFAGTTVGLASPGQIITITNPGSSPVAGMQVQLTGDFASTASSCTASLPALGSCAVQVAFKPTVSGGRQGFLIVNSTTSSVAQVFATLIGTGLTPPVLTITPPQLSFPATVIAQPSSPLSVQLTNSGQSPVPDLQLAHTPGFQLSPSATTCSSTLAAAATCTVAVLFDPAASGNFTGSLSATSALVSSLGGSPAVVALSGTGAVAPAIVPTPGTLIIFPTTAVKSAATPVLVSITNPGTLTGLANLQIATDATATAAGFSVTSTTCTASLAPGANCTATLGLTPATAGSLTGNLILSSSTLTNPVKIQLVGTGFDFKLASSGATSATVIPGQTGYFNFTLTPLGAASGTVNYQCGTLPTNALCLFNPAQQPSLPANVQGNVTLAVATGGSTGTSGAGPSRGLAAAAVFASILLLLPFPRTRSFRRHLCRFSSLLLLVVALVLGVTSCAGAGGSGGSGGQVDQGGLTPAGTYMIQVSATASGITHSTSVTVVVN